MIPTSSPLVVTGMTGNAVSPIVVEVIGHGLSTSNVVVVDGSRGNTAANGTKTITYVDADHFRLDGTTGNGAWTGGGGVWVSTPRSSLAAGTLDLLDATLPLRVTDLAGDKMRGTYAASAATAIDDAAGSLGIAVRNGATATTLSGARYRVQGATKLGSRARSILVPLHETFVEYPSVNSCGLSGPYGGIASRKAVARYAFNVPLRVHDGATLLRATLFFFPQLKPGAFGYALPQTFPTFQLYRRSSAAIRAVPMAAAGVVTFSGPGAADGDAYAVSPGVGSTGSAALAMLGAGASAVLSAGTVLTEPASGTAYVVTTGGTYVDGAPIPVEARVPDTGALYGSETNLAPGTALYWDPRATPLGAKPTALVGSAGLTGGLDPGHAQSIVLTPDAGVEVLSAQNAYFARFTDDDVDETFWRATVFTAIRLDLGSIADARPQ